MNLAKGQREPHQVDRLYISGPRNFLQKNWLNRHPLHARRCIAASVQPGVREKPSLLHYLIRLQRGEVPVGLPVTSSNLWASWHVFSLPGEIIVEDT